MNKKTYCFDFWKGTFYIFHFMCCSVWLRYWRWQTHQRHNDKHTFMHLLCNFKSISQNIKQKSILPRMSCLPLRVCVRARAGSRRAQELVFTLQQEVPQLVLRHTPRLRGEMKREMELGVFSDLIGRYLPLRDTHRCVCVCTREECLQRCERRLNTLTDACEILVNSVTTFTHTLRYKPSVTPRRQWAETEQRFTSGRFTVIISDLHTQQ